MKLLIQKTTWKGDLDVALFQRAPQEWRNTPNATGQSPAQALYGLHLSSFLFAHHASFGPEWQGQVPEIDQHGHLNAWSLLSSTTTGLPALDLVCLWVLQLISSTRMVGQMRRGW
eukprot:scpid107141/ scgid15329/ 